MMVTVKRIFFVVCVSLTFAYGTTWAEDGVGGATDFNADTKSRIAVIEEAVDLNQSNISVNAEDIATLMSGGAETRVGIANALLQDDEGLPPLPANTTSMIVTGNIKAPTDGFVLALASLQFRAEGTGTCELGLSQDNTLPPYQDVSANSSPATVHGIFAVNAGENDFLLLGRSRNGAVCRPNDVNLSLIFFPSTSTFGTVTSN